MPRPCLKVQGDDVKRLDRILADIERSDAWCPVLLKKYLHQNARILGFNRDPKFNDRIGRSDAARCARPARRNARKPPARIWFRLKVFEKDVARMRPDPVLDRVGEAHRIGPAACEARPVVQHALKRWVMRLRGLSKFLALNPMRKCRPHPLPMLKSSVGVGCCITLGSAPWVTKKTLGPWTLKDKVVTKSACHCM